MDSELHDVGCSSVSESDDQRNSSIADAENIPQCFKIGIEKVSGVGDVSWFPNVPEAKKPVCGMVFNSIDDAWLFYKEYPMISGFEPKKSTSKPPVGRVAVVAAGLVKLKIFKCAKSEKNRSNSSQVNTLKKSDSDTVSVSESDEVNMSHAVEDGKKQVKRRKTSSKKTGCANIRLSLHSDMKYHVYVVNEEHNHCLVHPDYIRHLNAFRNVNFSNKRMLLDMNEASVGPTAAHRILSKFAGSEDIEFTKRDARNYKRDFLAFTGDNDCQMVVDLLSKKKNSMNDFSFDYFIDSDNRLGGFFWDDEYAKRNYEIFGDVVSFDAIYRTNKYDMVFIPFTGIDNHKKCVTFGARMLSKENVASYKWLLEAFTKAYPSHPKLILTDQDPAMKIAIQAVFSVSRDRLCMWHIMDKVTSKVSAVVCNDGFKAKLGRIVWTDKLQPDVFDHLWDVLITEYDLHDNRWLSDMFDLRRFWIPTYFRDWKLSAMCEQRFNQSKNDHESSYPHPKMVYDWVVEKEASQIFTRAVFDDIVYEMGYAIKKCMSLSYIESEGVKKFIIVDTSVLSTDLNTSIDRNKEPQYFDENFPKESEVLYILSSEELSCSCKRYERFGMLCRHIFYVIRICKILHFPPKYVCKRWTKDVVPPEFRSNGFCNIGPANIDMGLRQLIQRVYSNVESALDKVVGNKEKLVKFLNAQEELLKSRVEDFEAADVIGNNEFISQMIGVDQPSGVDVRAPEGIRNKCSGFRKRIRSSREKSIEQQKKIGRACSYCGSYDKHNIRTCPAKIQDDLKKKANGEGGAGSCS